LTVTDLDKHSLPKQTIRWQSKHGLAMK